MSTFGSTLTFTSFPFSFTFSFSCFFFFSFLIKSIGNENFPHGIEIITIADYFSLGNRNNSYLTIAPAVAILDAELHIALKDHLINVKLSHCDNEMRWNLLIALDKLILPYLPLCQLYVNIKIFFFNFCGSSFFQQLLLKLLKQHTV